MSSNLREYIEGLKQTKKTGSLKEYVLKTKASKAADEIARLGNSWLDDSNKLIDGYNARYASGSNNYRTDSSEWLDGVKVSTQRLAQDADSIRSLLGKYSGYYDPKWVKSVTDMLDSNLSAQNEIYQKSLKDREYWSKFKDEEDYKNYLSLNSKLSDVAKITLETATKASVGDEAHNFGLEVAKAQLKNNPVLMYESLYGSEDSKPGFSSEDYVKKVLGSSPKTAPDVFNNGFEGYTGTVKVRIPDEPLMENSMIKINRNDLIVEKPKYEEVDVTPFYDDIRELAAARAQNRDRLKESYPGATDEELDEILNEAERRKQQRQAQSAGTGGTWFSSGGFDSDYPVLSTLRGIGGTALDIVGNIGSGIIEVGENVLDTLGVITAGVFRVMENSTGNKEMQLEVRPGDKVLVADSEEYFRTGRLITYEMDAEEWLAAARASEKKQKKISDELLDFVKTDLWDVNKPSRAVDDISFLGEKADSVAQSAGQMLATYGLAGMNIPWAATTAVTSFGSGAESALLEGAGLEGAILYGLANAATEILTEKLFKGSGLGEKGLFDTGKITKNISDKLVRSLADYGVDLMSEGAEEVVAEFANRLASKLYKEEDLITLLASDEAIEAYIDAFIGGTVISGFMNTSQNAMANASTSATYNGELGKGQTKEDKSKAQMELHQSLVTEALEIDPNNSFAKRMQAKIESGKALSGNELRLLTEGNDEALISQDQEKIKDAVRTRLEQLGETEDVNRLADIISKVGIGENITMSERKLLANSKYGKFVSDEIGGKYDSAWVKNIELERANVGRAEEESFNNDVYALAERMAALEDEEKTPNIALNREAQAYLQRMKELLESENAPKKETATESKFEASETGKAKIGDTEVVIKEIASVKNGEVMLRLDNGEEVNARDVEFGNEKEALLYEAVADMDIDTANDFIQGYNSMKNAPLVNPQSVSDYMVGFNEARTYGELGIPYEAFIRDGSYVDALIGNQARIAYNRGKINGINKAKTAQETRTSGATEATVDKAKTPRKYKGETHISKIKNSPLYKSLSPRQKASIDGLTAIYKALGIDVYLFESPVDASGKRLGKNGYFNPVDRSVHIDLFAGKMGDAKILFTAPHELTHYIRESLPEKFKVFADILFERLEANGTSVAGLIAAKKISLKQNGRTKGLTNEQINDLAYEEVVADACEAMMADGEAFVQIAEKIKAKDKGLWEAIKDFFANLVAKIKAAYEGLDPDSYVGQEVAKMLEDAKDLQRMWVDMLVEASEVSDIVEIDTNTQSVSPMLSERTWTASEYVTEREKTAKAISKALNVGVKTAYKYIDDINGVARLIADDRARLDYEPNLDENATVLKPNSDYKYSVDMSTLCAKRLLFTGTFDAIQRALPNMVFDSEDIVALREMMQKRGYEVACGICYVESTRREIGRITQDFIDSYKESQKTGKPITRTNSEGKIVDLKKTKDQMDTTADKSTDKFFAEKDYTPTLADLNTTDIDLVKRDHPLVYEAYLNFMNARGQAKPKLLETRAEYKGEILKHFKYKSAVDSRNRAGGLRLQSFSDFEVPHMIDMMQIVMDMSRVGLMSQAYTKVPAFAEIFGDTGVKINLSLIAKGDGLDPKGNLIFDDVEGINHEEAFKLRDKYSKNVGTILVGKTDAHIIAAMADSRIDYIIPFHKSSWKESLYDALGLTGYADYTDFQNEKPIDKDRKIKNFEPSEYWDFTKSGDENAQIYLEKCREDGRIPKFPQFQGYPGYWKLLIDFKMYDNDGVGSPQEVVKPIFDTEASERILSEYEGGHRSFPVAKDVVEDFVKEHKYSDRDSSDNNYDSRIKYSPREDVLSWDIAWDSNNYSSIKEQLLAHIDEVNSMQPVTSVVYNKNDGKPYYEHLDEILRTKFGYKIERQDHGSITFDPDAIKGMRKYVGSDAEAAAVIASPYVLKRGRAISGQKNHKDKGYPSVIYAAPATLNGEVGNIAVSVLYGDARRVHSLRVLTPGGKEFILVDIKNTELQNGGSVTKSAVESPISSVSKDRIAQKPNFVNRMSQKNSLRNVEPIETADYVKMYHHFGSTKNYDVAGYILGNGIMLDFSGKHWGDDYSTSRQVDHRDIQEVLGNRDSNNGVNAMIDMIGNGNIRLMPEVGGINLAVKPNSTQLSQLRGYINHFKGEVVIDIDEVGGDTIHSFSYPRGTSSTKVLADIKAYFDEGIVPKQREEGETDIRQFLNSDRDDSVSNRTLLANALESTIDTSTQDGKNTLEKLQEYKGIISEIEKLEAKRQGIIQKASKLQKTKGKTPDEIKEMKDLWLESKKIANRIDIYDGQLLRIEAMKPIQKLLYREKARAYKEAKQKGKEALAAYKEKSAKTQRELMNRYQESRKKGVEERRKTEMRRKIRKVVKDLNHLLNHGTKERNVKEGEKDVVASAISVAELLFSDDISNADIVRLGVDNPSALANEKALLKEYKSLLDSIKVTDDQIAGLQTLDNPTQERYKLMDDLEAVKKKHENKISTLDKKLSDFFARERARLNEGKVADVIGKLVNEYSALENSGDDYIKNAYSENVKKRLEALQKGFDGTLVRDMTLPQLVEVYDAYKMIEYMVRTSNNLFREGRMEDLMEFVRAVQSEIYNLYKTKKDPIAFIDDKKNIVNTFSWNNLKPVYAFDRLGSATFQKLYWDAVRADDDFAVMITEAGRFLQEQREKYGFADWDLTAAKEFKLADGKVFKLTLEDMMSIYAYSKRDQADAHMTEGGFVFDENNTYTAKPFDGEKILENFRIKKKHAKLTETYLIDDRILAEIVGFFNKEENADKKSYVDAMQKYMTDMGQKGNEVSRALFGIDLFTDENYIPLKSSSDYLNSNKQALEKTPTQVSLKNNGTTKPTVPGANNPIVLRAFDDLWLEHIDTMSKYCAYVLPIENLTRVFNNVSRLEGKSPMATKSLISAVFGNGAKAYFDQYITDLNGGISIGGYQSPLMAMFSRFKGTAVAAKLSVIIQQPLSIIRAMTMIRPDYFVPFLRGQRRSKDVDSTWEEIKKYAPIAILKEMGGYDIGSAGTTKDYIGITEYKGAKGRAKGFVNDPKYRKKVFDDLVMIGAVKMDELGWGIIWKAVKKEVATEQNLTPGTEEFFKAVRDRFTEVVVRTQVYDSVNSRSGLMRSKSDLNKFATSFMGEPTTVINMFYNAVLQAIRAIKSKDKALTKQNIGHLARTSGVLLATLVLTALAKAAPYANQDDDDDESWTERWMKHFGESLASDLNPLSMIPYTRDLVSIYEGWDIERPDMTLIARVVTSAKRAIEDGATKEEILNLSGDIANMVGLPAKNVVRDVKGIYNLISDHFDDITTVDAWGAFGRGWRGEEQTKSEALYKAIVNGDSGRIKLYESSYKTKSDYTSAVRKALRDNDPRIKMAALARYNGNIAEYTRIAKLIIAEKHFSQDDVVAAINAVGNVLKKKDGTTDSSTSKDSNKARSIYNMGDYYAALVGRDEATAYAVKEDIIKIDVANGKDRDEAEADFNSSFASHIRDLYDKGNVTDYEAKSMLVSFGGKTEKKATSRVQYWNFKQEYPDYDLSEEAVTKYYNDVEPSGIDVDVYYDYYKQKAKCEGTDANGDGKTDNGSVKSQVLHVINSMPLTPAQKDVLYYLDGWSKSTIWEAPWH